MFDKFSVFDLIIIAMILPWYCQQTGYCAPGHIITGPLMIPGGVVGGFTCCGWCLGEVSVNREQQLNGVIRPW